jgi:hypothetical protein
MTADKKIVSIVDKSVARIIREYYGDPDKGAAVLRRYHPGVTKKEILAAFKEVPEETVLRNWIKELTDLCRKPGGADLKGLFELISTCAKKLPSDDFWGLLETAGLPPDQAAWLRRQLETSWHQRGTLQHGAAKSLTTQGRDSDENP